MLAELDCRLQEQVKEGNNTVDGGTLLCVVE